MKLSQIIVFLIVVTVLWVPVKAGTQGTFADDSLKQKLDASRSVTATSEVLGPILPNLAFTPRAGWWAPLVPRGSDNATENEVPAPVLLPGDEEQTWLNVSCQNDAAVSCDPPTLTIHSDGILLETINYLFGIAPHGYFGRLNLGPSVFTGGRHTLRVTADPDDVISELNEDDNVLAVQYAWAPQALSYETPVVREAPPSSMADLDLLPGAAVENCDGVRITKGINLLVPRYDWMVVWNQRLASMGLSYFMKLYEATDDPEDGFMSVLGGTQWGGGLEALIINMRQVTPTSFDVGIYNYSDTPESYEIGLTSEGATDLIFGGEIATPFTGDRVRIVEFHSSISNLGPATLTLATDPSLTSLSPLHIGWLAPANEIANLADLNDMEFTDAKGLAKINFTISQIGYHAAVIYQDDATAPLTFTLGLWGAMPDLEPYRPPGWGAALVPRSAADATEGSCALPDTLYGEIAATWLNVTLINSGNAVADTVGFVPLVDGDTEMSLWNPVAFLAPNETWSKINLTKLIASEPFTVPGGRHTLTSKVDWREDLAESVERNNWTGAQYCWSPAVIPAGPMTRDAPPDRTGGHADCDPGQTLYNNCDGLRLGPPNGSPWRGFAVMPPALTVDIDVALYEPLIGTQEGFGPNPLAQSSWPAGAIDFVLINDNVAPETPYDVGVVRNDETIYSSYNLEAVTAVHVGGFPVGPTETFSMPAGHMLALYEYFLAPGPQLISLQDMGSNVDWGISIYGQDDFFCRTNHLPSGSAFSEPAGITEQIYVNIPNTGNYCIAVWKVNRDQLNLDGTYCLSFAPGATAVDDPVPNPVKSALLNSATPNPFNPRTVIHFTLAADGPCNLVVYDLQGRIIRSLVAEERRAGLNTASWNGLDDNGNQVASGVYLAHLAACGTTDQLKLTLVK